MKEKRAALICTALWSYKASVQNSLGTHDSCVAFILQNKKLNQTAKQFTSLNEVWIKPGPEFSAGQQAEVALNTEFLRLQT